MQPALPVLVLPGSGEVHQTLVGSRIKFPKTFMLGEINPGKVMVAGLGAVLAWSWLGLDRLGLGLDPVLRRSELEWCSDHRLYLQS